MPDGNDLASSNRTRLRLFLCTVALIWLSGVSGGPKAQTLTAVLTAPADGSTVTDPAQSFAWTIVPGAQAYYLYVGTTPGAKDLVDSRETLQTTYAMPSLPRGHTLYVRLWTKSGNVWRYGDSQFTYAVVVTIATLQNPQDGSDTADYTRPITWTAVPNAQAYYLYVGTTAGAKNLVDTGETQQTSYFAVLPVGLKLYARIWTKLGGAWNFTDSSFTAKAATISFRGAASVFPTLADTVQWTGVPNAQAYYLYAGTTPGATDLVNSGETLNTEYPIQNVSRAQTLYMRLWTKADNVWRYVDRSFVPHPAALLYPVDGSINADVSLPIQWTRAPNAQSYYLYVGTSVGAKDIVDSRETQQTWFVAHNVPSGQKLYARLWTKINNNWEYTDTTFSAMVSSIVRPAVGPGAADLFQPISWFPVPNAQAYYLYIGTAPGLKDLRSTGETQATNWAPEVWTTQTMYARLYTKLGGVWRYTDTVINGDPNTPHFTSPAGSGTPALTEGQPITWTSVPGATAYRITIGTTRGAADIKSSGNITQTSYSPGTLPTGQVIYARMSATTGGSWRFIDTSFTVVP